MEPVHRGNHLQKLPSLHIDSKGLQLLMSDLTFSMNVPECKNYLTCLYR